jgi:integrase
MTTRALTDAEILLLESALIDRRRYRDRLFLLFAVGTGFRVSEIVSIDWRQLLTAGGEVVREVIVERAMLKGGAGQRRKSVRSRRVPLSERVRGAIADYLGTFQAIPGGVVFKSRTGDNQAITRGQAYRLLKRLAREVGIDATRLGCHSTRKTFAVRAHRAAQFDLVKTQRILGHRSVSTTAKYIETCQDELDALVLGMDAAPAVAVPAALAMGELRRPTFR